MLGASAVHRLTRRVHKLHMLDIEHILPAMERTGARSERPQKDAHIVLPMGAVHLALAGAHVLHAVDPMALDEHQDGL